MDSREKVLVSIGVLLLIIAIALGVWAYMSWEKAKRINEDLKLANDYIEKELDAFANGDNDRALEYFKMARERLKDALKLDPNLGVAYYELAVAYGNDGFFHHYYKFPNQTKFTQAIPWYLKHGNRKMAEWMLWAQWAYENATRYAKEALKYPNLKGLAYEQLGAIAYDYYDNYTARRDIVLRYDFMALKYEDQIRKYSGNYGLSALYTNIARTYLAMAEPWNATKWYWKSYRTYPIDTAYEHLIWALIDLGNWSGAYDVSMKYLEHKEWESDLGLMPAAISAFYIGYPYYEKGNYTEAKRWWNRSLRYCDEIIEKFGRSSDYYGEAVRLKALIYFYLGCMGRGGYLNESLKLLENDVKAMTDHIEHPEVPAELPGSYYERALAHYYIGLIHERLGQDPIGDFDKAKEDLLCLMNEPWMSNREVAHRNYYVLSYIAMSGLYIKMANVTGNSTYIKLAKDCLARLQNVLTHDVELTGWRKMFERRYGKNFAEGLFETMKRVGGIPVYFGVLEH